MKYFNSLLQKLTPTGAILGLTVVSSLSIVAQPASAFTIGSLPSGFDDTDFNNLLLNGDIAELFVDENRGGNNTGSGDRETGINQPIVPDGMGGLTGGLPFPGASGQGTWPNGDTVAFTLTFDPTTDTVTYEVDGFNPSILTAMVGPENPDSIYIRTRAQTQSGSGTATNSLTSLELDDGSGFQSIPDLQSMISGSGSDVNYLLISDLNSPFTLRGSQTFSWTDGFPTGSRIASQFKLTYDLVPSTPEPSSILGLLAIGGLGLAKLKKQA